MNKLYEELGQAINRLAVVKFECCYDETNELQMLELKIESIEAKLLSLQYRTVVGHLYGDLIATRYQEKEARNDLLRKDGVTKKA